MRRGVARQAGSSVCRSGRLAAARAANTVRFDGLAIRIAAARGRPGILRRAC